MYRQGIGIHDEQAAFIKKVAKGRKIPFSQALREVLQFGIDRVKDLHKQSRR